MGTQQPNKHLYSWRSHWRRSRSVGLGSAGRRADAASRRVLKAWFTIAHAVTPSRRSKDYLLRPLGVNAWDQDALRDEFSAW
jgi:hypothetical protein